ncbi:hypothetical protein ACLOJK_026950 [Asimina triloba]
MLLGAEMEGLPERQGRRVSLYGPLDSLDPFGGGDGRRQGRARSSDDGVALGRRSGRLVWLLCERKNGVVTLADPFYAFHERYEYLESSPSDVDVNPSTNI